MVEHLKCMTTEAQLQGHGGTHTTTEAQMQGRTLPLTGESPTPTPSLQGTAPPGAPRGHDLWGGNGGGGAERTHTQNKPKQNKKLEAPHGKPTPFSCPPKRSAVCGWVGSGGGGNREGPGDLCKGMQGPAQFVKSL